MDWSSYYPLPSDAGPAASAFLTLVATPLRAVELVAEGEMLEELRCQVQRYFAVLDPVPPTWRPQHDAVELIWRHPLNGITRQWRRGCDGSFGFTTTIESAWKTGHVSLWDVALDYLMFVRATAGILMGECVRLMIHFEPSWLAATASPLAPADSRKAALAGLGVEMHGPDPATSNIRPASEELSPLDLGAAFAKLAALLVHRWRPIFSLPALGAKPLSTQLASLAETELGWTPTRKTS
ncbi:MAG: hypothetical protein KC464_18575 [Myxococcales bacterium]|nr:hypothetical protein [Myxococcales bacterium]